MITNLEILFKDRNKEYGAYQLRLGYNKRLSISLLITLLLTVFISSFGFIPKSDKDNTPINISDVKLEKVEPIKEEVKITEPKKVEEVKIKTVKSTTIQIIKDENYKEESAPPEVEEIEDSKIGIINVDGNKDDGTVTPPLEEKGTGSSIDITPKKQDYDTVFTKVENPADFPGGISGWTRFLERNLTYPQSAIDNEIQGVVKLQFIIDRDGSISNIEALNDPGYGLAEEAIRIIKKSPKWIPAEQNGRKVIYRTIQSITFRLE